MKIPWKKLRGTPFELKVWKAIAEIPRGRTMTYGELAKKIGRPKACRAVGAACGKNPLPVIIPCHRVVAGNGKIGGYSGKGGVERKRRLLEEELGKRRKMPVWVRVRKPV